MCRHSTPKAPKRRRGRLCCIEDTKTWEGGNSAGTAEAIGDWSGPVTDARTPFVSRLRTGSVQNEKEECHSSCVRACVEGMVETTENRQCTPAKVGHGRRDHITTNLKVAEMKGPWKRPANCL